MQSTALDFERDVIEASKQTSIVVDFWAEWCAPCRILGPILEKLADTAQGAWKLVKVNTEEHPQVSMNYDIRGIPAVKMFYNGEVIAEFVGALPEVQVRRWLDENIPTESKKIVQEAKQALADGDRDRARGLFEQAVEKDQSNFEARIHLAQFLFESEPEKARGLVKETPREHPLHINAEAIQTLSCLLTEYEKISEAADSTQAWQHYLTGIQALEQHNYEEALKNWIDALIMDKTIDDDGPRKACIALFSWLGQKHELTKKYHRSFTSALF